MLGVLGVLAAGAVAGANLLRHGDSVAALAEPAGVAQDKPGPVLLVPGYGGGRGGLDQLAARLRQTGRTATVLTLRGDGTGDLRAEASVLDAAVTAALTAGAPSVDLVGYSAGGVVVRLWAREHDAEAKARRVVTLGAPHHGADVAQLAAALAAGACPAACRQLVPGSALLDRLNQGDETPPGPLWTSIWSGTDQIVTPPTTARLAGATNIAVQQVCPGVQVSHGQLPTDPTVTGLVLQALAVAAPTAPDRGDCAALSS